MQKNDFGFALEKLKQGKKSSHAMWVQSVTDFLSEDWEVVE